MLVLYFSSLTGRLGFRFLFTVMTLLAGSIIFLRRARYEEILRYYSNDGDISSLSDSSALIPVEKKEKKKNSNSDEIEIMSA